MAKSATTPPDLSTIGGRLRWAREEQGFTSSRSAAKAFGWNENTYKAHEQGERGAEGLKKAAIERYTRAFKINAEWLMMGKGPAIADKTEGEWKALSPEERRKALRLVKAAS